VRPLAVLAALTFLAGCEKCADKPGYVENPAYDKNCEGSACPPMCIPPEALGRDGGVWAEGDAGAAVGREGRCWNQSPSIPTEATARAKLRPLPMRDCSDSLEYSWASEVCVETVGPHLIDVDDDCDGCIDERAGCADTCQACGGRPWPADMYEMKPSARTFAADAYWRAHATAEECNGPDCSALVFEARYFCVDGRQTFQAFSLLLDRDDHECLRARGERPQPTANGERVCGVGGASRWLASKLTTCSNAAVTTRVSVNNGTPNLTIRLGESQDPRVAPRHTDEEWERLWRESMNCMSAYHADANHWFWWARDDSNEDGMRDVCVDTDGDGVGDEDDNCVDDPNPEQENADGDQPGDACDNCVDDMNSEQEDEDEDGVGDVCQLAVVDEQQPEDPGPRFSHLIYSETIFTGFAEDQNPFELVQQTVDWDRESYLSDDRVGAAIVPANRGNLEHVEDAIERFSEWEVDQGSVSAQVFGGVYENWAEGTYGHSQRHEAWAAEQGLARSPCGSQMRVPRTDRDWNNPQPLTYRVRARNGQVQGAQWPRHRRWDWGCLPVNHPASDTRLPPLGEEDKATSKPNHRRYSSTYHRWLVNQCKDMRFHLAKLYADEFGQPVSKTFRLMSRSTAQGRPYLTYRFFRSSPALQAVMAECNFSERFPWDDGVWGEEQVASARSVDRRANMHVYRETRPIWYQPPDSPECDGPPLWIARRGCVQQGSFDPRTGLCLPGQWPSQQAGLYTVCTGERENGNPQMFPTKFLSDERGWLGRFQFGYKMFRTPVCPAEFLNPTAARINERIISGDGIRRVLPTRFPEFVADFASFHQFGFPVRMGMRPMGGIPTSVDPGFWIVLSKGVFFDTLNPGVDDPGLDEFPIIGGAGVGLSGMPHLGFDADEVRDMCKD
jgi:hypothetical protein